MGLLDEAIREHLELKRRQGADPREVQRMEGEALGPVRAEPAPPAAAPAEAVGEEHAPPPETSVPEVEAPVAPPAPTRVVGGAVSMDDYVVEHPEPSVEAGPVDAGPGELAAEDAELARETSDDVLEETPEFLQETPEHERLWFEQKPPKDFDF